MAQSFDQKSVFVALSNLAPSASKQNIQRLLAVEAAVFKMGNLYTDETSIQFCDVELFNQRDVRNVLTLNGKIFLGYEMSVLELVPQENPLEVFVRKVSLHATEAEIASLFAQFGQIEEVTLPRWYDSGKPRGFAFIRFGEEDSARKAVECDDELIFYGIRLSIRPNRRVDHAHKKPQVPKDRVSKRMAERPQGCRTIYIGNVDFDASESEISELFSKCGTVLNVRVVRQQFTNRSRGFAYVEFDNEECVTKAIAMDGQDFLGRNIRVDFAEAFDPTRTHTKNFSTFTASGSSGNDDENGFGNYLDNYLPTPSSFIKEHFVDTPWAGMAALAGCMTEQQLQLQQAMQLAQYQQHLMQMAAANPFVPPFIPNCSVPMFAPLSVPQTPPIGVSNMPHVPMMQQMPNMPNVFNHGRTTQRMNFAQGGEPVQLDPTLFTQGIPGVGQFIAPYAMLAQRPVPVTRAQTIQAKPPAKAPVSSTEQQTCYGSSVSKPRFPSMQRSFSPQDISSAQNTGTNMSTVSSPPGTAVSESVSSPYVISDSIEHEPWEIREVDNAILY